MLNMHFENVGEDKDFRHDDTYANVNTTLAWNVTKPTLLPHRYSTLTRMRRPRAPSHH